MVWGSETEAKNAGVLATSASRGARERECSWEGCRNGPLGQSAHPAASPDRPHRFGPESRSGAGGVNFGRGCVVSRAVDFPQYSVNCFTCPGGYCVSRAMVLSAFTLLAVEHRRPSVAVGFEPSPRCRLEFVEDRR